MSLGPWVRVFCSGKWPERWCQLQSLDDSSWRVYCAGRFDTTDETFEVVDDVDPDLRCPACVKAVAYDRQRPDKGRGVLMEFDMSEGDE